jgi:hypothetical protein
MSYRYDEKTRLMVPVTPVAPSSEDKAEGERRRREQEQEELKLTHPGQYL